MVKVVAPLAFRLGLNLNRVFVPKLARERGEPWTARALRAKACERDRDALPRVIN
jgi:hypothetical protein